MQWESDLIGYDAMSSYGSPGYYAQAMFAEYLGTEVPASSVTGGGERFFYSVTRDAAKGAVYLKLVNASSVAQPVSIEMSGAGSGAKTGTLVSLTGTNNAETNSITAPRRVVPVRTELRVAGARFNHTVPGYSVQVLVIGTR
jgi:alpha-N-arabinofuranosidase